MKTLKKILVGTLTSLFVFASANAGELSISGSMEVSALQVGGEATGNRLGMENELTITGSTETDGGIGVAYKQTVTGAMGFNDSELAFSTPYGGIAFTSTGGTIEDVDNIVPTAFEEAEALWASADADWDDVGDSDGTFGIKYTNTVPVLGMGLTAFYTPKAESGDGNSDDSAAAIGSSDKGDLRSITLRGNPLGIIDGIDLVVAYEKAQNLNSTRDDDESGTVGINYTYGPLKVGAQVGARNEGRGTTTGVRWYKNTYAGIAYAVNDNFSISYQESTSQKNTSAARGDVGKSGRQSSSVKTAADSISATYTVGGLTVAYVDTDVDNAEYTLNRKRSANQVVLSVAF